MRFIYKLLIKGGYLQYRGYCRLSWFYSVVYFSSKEMQLWVFQLEGSLIGEGGDHLKFGMGVGGVHCQYVGGPGPELLAHGLPTPEFGNHKIERGWNAF